MLGRVASKVHPSASVKLAPSHALRAVRSNHVHVHSSSRSSSIPSLRLYSSSLPQSLRTNSSISSRTTATVYRTFSTTSTMAASTRTETDAFGPLEVDSTRYWGAQTQRSLGNFNINQPQDRMPDGVVRAFGILKGAAATVNMRYGLGMFGTRSQQMKKSI